MSGHFSVTRKITARALATYLIPGCVGRGVRLGSEGSSVGGGGGGGSGGVWIWGPKNQKKKLSKFKSVLPKMSARSGLVGKKSSWPYLGPSEAIFSIDRKNQKNAKILPIFLGGPMGPYSPGLGPCCSGSQISRFPDQGLGQAWAAFAAPALVGIPIKPAEAG